MKDRKAEWYQFESIGLNWSEWVLVVIAIIGILVICCIPLGRVTHARAGAIVTDGDSMHESVPFGSLIFCLPLRVHDGNLVIAITNDGIIVVKRLSNGALISENFFGERFEQGTFTVLSKVLLVVYSPLYTPKGSIAAERIATHHARQEEAAKQEPIVIQAEANRIRKPAGALDLRQVVSNGGSISAYGGLDPTQADKKTYGSLDPTLAVDGNPQTFWAPALAGESWWQLRLDKPHKVKVDFGNSAGLDNKNIQTSLDGRSWQLAKMTSIGLLTSTFKYLRISGEQNGDLHLNLPLNLTEVRVTPCN